MTDMEEKKLYTDATILLMATSSRFVLQNNNNISHGLNNPHNMANDELMIL